MKLIKTLPQFKTKCGMYINAESREMAQAIAAQFNMELAS